MTHKTRVFYYGSPQNLNRRHSNLDTGEIQDLWETSHFPECPAIYLNLQDYRSEEILLAKVDVTGSTHRLGTNSESKCYTKEELVFSVRVVMYNLKYSIV